jgi:hypothetical protein
VFREELEDLARRRGAEIIWMIDRVPGLSHAVRVALREVGLQRRHLHEEVFGF